MIGFHKPVENPEQNELVKQLFYAWKALKQQSKGLKRQARKIVALRKKIDALEIELYKKNAELIDKEHAEIMRKSMGERK